MTNREYLEQKITECEAGVRRTQQLIDGWQNAVKTQQSALAQELANYAKLKTKKKRKWSEERQAAIRKKLGEAEAKVTTYTMQIESQKAECSKLNQQLDQYINAVNTATENGLDTEAAEQYAETKVEETIAQLKADQAKETEQAVDKDKQKLALIIGGIFLVLIIAIILFLVFRKKKK